MRTLTTSPVPEPVSEDRQSGDDRGQVCRDRGDGDHRDTAADLVPPDKGNRNIPRPGWVGGCYSWMRQVLAYDFGRSLYRKRKQTVEPLFGHTKHNCGVEPLFGHTKHNCGVKSFHRRGRVKVRPSGDFC